jgi:Uma2 family endonuclease
MGNITGELYLWLNPQQSPRDRVVCGETVVQLGDDDSTAFGVDVAVVSHEVMAQQTNDHTTIKGVPSLIVEILSPSTVVSELRGKIRADRRAGVPLVWVVDPDDRMVTIHQPNIKQKLVNEDEVLTGEDVLPEFRVEVAKLFQ